MRLICVLEAAPSLRVRVSVAGIEVCIGGGALSFVPKLCEGLRRLGRGVLERWAELCLGLDIGDLGLWAGDCCMELCAKGGPA